MTSRKSCPYPCFLQTRMQNDRWLLRFFKILRRSVDGKHLMRFQSETSVFKFLRPSVDGALILLRVKIQQNHDGDPNENVFKQKVLMSKTMVLQVRFQHWYISWPSSAKQQREMTKFCVFWRTWTATGNFVVFSFGVERCRCIFSMSKCVRTNGRTKQIYTVTLFEGKMW